jgi:hypothetical protein
MGLASLGLDISIFCDFLYSVLLLDTILGVDFLGPALSRPQVRSSTTAGAPSAPTWSVRARRRASARRAPPRRCAARCDVMPCRAPAVLPAARRSALCSAALPCGRSGAAQVAELAAMQFRAIETMDERGVC